MWSNYVKYHSADAKVPKVVQSGLKKNQRKNPNNKQTKNQTETYNNSFAHKKINGKFALDPPKSVRKPAAVKTKKYSHASVFGS